MLLKCVPILQHANTSANIENHHVCESEERLGPSADSRFSLCLPVNNSAWACRPFPSSAMLLFLLCLLCLLVAVHMQTTTYTVKSETINAVDLSRCNVPGPLCTMNMNTALLVSRQVQIKVWYPNIVQNAANQWAMFPLIMGMDDTRLFTMSSMYSYLAASGYADQPHHEKLPTYTLSILLWFVFVYACMHVCMYAF
jgi:hypothetical protein